MLPSTDATTNLRAKLGNAASYCCTMAIPQLDSFPSLKRRLHQRLAKTMVPEQVPVALRVFTIVLSIVTFATGGAGHLKSCTFGETHYNSHHQINFVIFVGVAVCVAMTLRVVLFDYKKRRLPSRKVQVAMDGVFVIVTFIAAVAGALSPIANDVCTGDNDMKIFIQEVCEFSCSDIVASVVMTFLMFVCFLVQILFTMNVIPVGTDSQPAEDFTFDENVGTPRARKINQNTQNAAIGQV